MSSPSFRGVGNVMQVEGNMQKLSRFVLSMSVGMILMGCGKPAFTEAVRARYALTDQEIRRLQLFTSDEIVLRREVVEQEKTRSGNALAIRDGVKVEEVIIPARTPGVAIRVEGERILVSFSREHPDHALWFGSKKRDDLGAGETRYELMPFADIADDSGEVRPGYTKGFLVQYGGRKYHVVDGKMWNAHLLYDLDEKFANDVKRAKAPGWHLSEGLPSVAPPSQPTKVTESPRDAGEKE